MASDIDIEASKYGVSSPNGQQIYSHKNTGLKRE